MFRLWFSVFSFLNLVCIDINVTNELIILLLFREIALCLQFAEIAVGSHAAILQHDDAVALLDGA